jgi:transcription initiation factor TFIIF subunit beta
MDDNGTNFIQPGQLGGSKSFNTFIKGKAALTNKTRDINARLPLKDLYDAIFKCFEEYEFWSLKAFKKKLKQPEAYLKDTLDNIATLHKRGPHVGTWELKQETKKAQQAGAAAEAAAVHEIKHEGQEAPEDLGDFTDADDDVEMEDRL